MVPTMNLELQPPIGVGPVRIGMTMDEAEAALRQIDGFKSGDTSLQQNPGWGHYEHALSISAFPGPGCLIEAIEVHRPSRPVVVRYDGIDVFGLPAAEVTELLLAKTSIRMEESGAAAVAPELYLSLWRPGVEDEDEDEEQFYYYQSALIAAPGYDD